MGTVAVECQDVKPLLYRTVVDTHLDQNMDIRPQEHDSVVKQNTNGRILTEKMMSLQNIFG